MSLLFTQESDFRKEREFGQKISAAFDFIRVHWRGLGRVMLYTVVPAALVYGVVSSVLQVTLLHRSFETLSGNQVGSHLNWNVTAAMMSSPAYWLNAVLSATFASLVILSVYGYLLCCLRGPSAGAAGAAAGRLPTGPVALAEIAVADVWAIIRREYLSTMLSTVGIYLLIVVGMIFLVVPGIYLSVTLSLFFIVKLVEGTGFGDTVSRCWQLIKGKWWSTAGLIFVMILLLYALVAVGGLVTTLLGSSVRGLLGTTGVEPSSLFAIIITVITTLSTLFFYPPLLLVLAFQYFNLVERREGVGLRGLVGQLGQAAPTAHNASYRADEEGEY